MAKYTGTNGNDNKASGIEADLMLGLLGDDTLGGSANRDTIDGGGGNDSLIGGNGFDTYAVENLGDRIVETGTVDSQSDQVQSFIDYTPGNGLESLRLKGADDLRAPTSTDCYPRAT